MRDAEEVAREILDAMWERVGNEGFDEDATTPGLVRIIRARDAEVAAKAWDEGYAVGEDNFIHSDYCGRRCQCQGLHGTTNPYREGGDDA